jgi:hypothetical protein
LASEEAKKTAAEISKEWCDQQKQFQEANRGVAERDDAQDEAGAGKDED